MGKAKYVWITLVPLLFVATTTFTAAFMLLKKYFIPVPSSFLDFCLSLKLDAFLVAMMLCLALVIVIDSIIKWCRFFLSEKPLANTEMIEQ
jgi:carbon starvation protein